MEEYPDLEESGGRRRKHFRLTDLKVKKVKAPGLYADGDCLYLLVGRTPGSKSWVFRYRRNGRLRDMGLGPLRTFSLAEARKKARAYRQLRWEGVDPIEARRAERQQAELEQAKAITFQQCAEAYIEDRQVDWRNAKHSSQWPNSLRDYVYPIIGALPAQAIGVGLVMKVLEQPVPGASFGDKPARLWWQKPETASRVRQRIENILDWAKIRGYREGENPARWKGHLENLLPKKTKVRPVKNHAALLYAELPAFMAALRNEKGIAARALEFTILTAMRTGAVIPAAPGEIKSNVWTVPAARMKGEQAKEKPKDFRVPLSAPALAIVEQMEAEDDAGFLFPGGKRSKPLSNMAMLKLLERSGRGDLTVHGFRSTFKTWATEQTDFRREVIEMSLAHAIDDKVEAAYQRGELFEKRQQLMEAWGHYCSTVPVATGVLSLRQVAR
jgi:integrase